MLRRCFTSNLLLRRHISALYVTGDQATEKGVTVTPFLDFEERLNNFEEIEENITRRKLKMDLDTFKNEYELFKSVEERKTAVEKRRAEFSQMIRESPANEGMKTQAIHLREDLKNLKENSYHLEDVFVHNFLSLPNFIHKITPDGEKKVVFSFKDEAKNLQSKSTSSSIDELVEYYDPTCYYMKNEAAKFDVFMPMQVMSYYHGKKFINFSNPDFTRSVIAEAAGVDSKELFLLKEDEIESRLNLLHLTGSGSFLSYLPFITKLTVFPSLLPLKFICTGKQYDATNHHDHQDLYNVVQATSCQSFIATADESTFDDILNEQVEHFISTFETFDQHFRIVYIPAHELTQAESCRLAVEMFSPSRNSYVEVGNFSCFRDYISKRLLFNYKEGKDSRFPHIYSGTVVNVMKLLLVLIENSKEFKCPNWLN